MSEIIKKTGKVAMAIAAIDLARKSFEVYNTFKEKYDTVKSSGNYTISIPNDSNLFEAVASRVLNDKLTPSPGQYYVYKQNTENLKVLPKDISDFDVIYNGEKIRVKFFNPESDSTSVVIASRGPVPEAFSKQKILLIANSQEGLEAASALVREASKLWEKEQRPPALKVHDWSANWSTISSLKHAKSFDSLCLDSGVKESILQTVYNFQENEDLYTARGIPYHLGFALTGPAGTGKTSIVGALAKHLGCSVHSLSLNSMESDRELAQAISGVDGILLIEDIDAHGLDLNRGGQEGKHITLSGLLNVLDGLGTPHGLITIITTNNPDALDPALIRPGRIDRVIKIDYATSYQIDSMFELFFDKAPRVNKPTSIDATPAEIMRILQSSIDYDDAHDKLEILYKERQIND